MKEVKLSDDEIQYWFKGPGSQNIVMPLPLPFTKNQLIQQFVSNPFGNMGGPPVAMRKAKPKASKKPWTAFGWEHLDIAIRTGGTVAVRSWGHRRLTLWIHPNGEAGTTADNTLEMDQLANEQFASTLIDIKNQVDEWAARGKGRKVPQGPSLLLEKSLDAVMKRREDHLKDGGKDGSFYKTPPREWPF